MVSGLLVGRSQSTFGVNFQPSCLLLDMMHRCCTGGNKPRGGLHCSNAWQPLCSSRVATAAAAAAAVERWSVCSSSCAATAAQTRQSLFACQPTATAAAASGYECACLWHDWYATTRGAAANAGWAICSWWVAAGAAPASDIWQIGHYANAACNDAAAKVTTRPSQPAGCDSLYS